MSSQSLLVGQSQHKPRELGGRQCRASRGSRGLAEREGSLAPRETQQERGSGPVSSPHTPHF